MAAETTTELIAERVETARVVAGITLYRLAELSGIPRTTLRRKLNGYTDFSAAELIRLGRLLDVPAAAWFLELPERVA